MERARKSSIDSRGWLIALWGLVFFAIFFSYAHTDPVDIFYHLLVDGCLLGVWLVSAWGFGYWLIRRGPSLLMQLTRIGVGLGVVSILILLLGLAGWL
ncbi:MAG TPA: hypothetical protein VGG19_08585, partial [Tepidisphaeraceae bacterium]